MPDSYKPTKGHCLLIPSGTDRHHLFVLITNACPANSYLAVSFSSIRPGIAHDSTCVVEAGAHSFLEVESYVLYARPKQLFRPGLSTCVSSRLYTQKDDCDADLLERVRAGLTGSAFTPRWAKEYFRINGER
jgi:hypothetical protein